MRDNFLLWVAQGFGSGRIPVAPGTFGSLVGLLWFAVLVRTSDLKLFVVGLVFGLGLSVWICGRAERILKQSDPSSIVLDEIVAVPLCFLGWTLSGWIRVGEMPSLESFFAGPALFQTGVVLALFRVFDILKPWPVRQSQRLAGGWGVTVDDLLAAVYVNLVQLPFLL